MLASRRIIKKAAWRSPLRWGATAPCMGTQHERAPADERGLRPTQKVIKLTRTRQRLFAQSFMQTNKRAPWKTSTTRGPYNNYGIISAEAPGEDLSLPEICVSNCVGNFSLGRGQIAFAPRPWQTAVKAGLAFLVFCVCLFVFVRL